MNVVIVLNFGVMRMCAPLSMPLPWSFGPCIDLTVLQCNRMLKYIMNSSQVL
jgi:hypothetical protein